MADYELLNRTSIMINFTALVQLDKLTARVKYGKEEFGFAKTRPLALMMKNLSSSKCRSVFSGTGTNVRDSISVLFRARFDLYARA